MTPAQEAAAFWGSAENPVYSMPERLMLALKALEFYGGLAERVEALADEVDEYNREMARQIRATLGPEETR